MSVRPAQLVALMGGSPSSTTTTTNDTRRNICILAHVDHGKTTLSDSLLAANGVISSKLAGKVRFLDSREDEQERGITMEASAISLFFKFLKKTTAPTKEKDRNQAQPERGIEESYLVNLIDSPGHVDFSSEVYTASRLCDGALVLVDAVEGVCTQTHTVLRQAWLEGVVPVLVINKIDRLITELKLTPLEAYEHLRKILEAVNAVVGSMWTGERMEEDERRRKREEQSDRQGESVEENQIDEDLSSALYEQWTLTPATDDSELYFSPERGNVIFASAVDGWAFRVNDFAHLYAAKLKTSEKLLNKCLWGDYYLDPKTKRVVTWKGLKGRSLKPIFVQFILENLWKVYDSVLIETDREQVEKIVKALNLKVLPREMKTKDSRSLLSTILSQWLPIAPAVLRTVVEHLPSPTAAQRLRLPRLLHPSRSLTTSTTTEPENSIEAALYSCDQSPDAPCVAYVSKVFSVPEECLSSNKRVQLSAEEMRARGREARAQRQATTASESERNNPTVLPYDRPTIPDSAIQETPEIPEKETSGTCKERLIGFARLYSGTLRPGMRLYILGPKYDPAYPDRFRSEMIVEDLYLVMGRDLEKLESVPAGCVFGIGLRPGNGDELLKSGTLSSVPGFKSLGRVGLESPPIVRVALEPADPTEMPQLIEGLRLLNQADPCVQVMVQETGEHVILTAGELHLERCLRDLRERFAKIEIQVSPPIVPFRETVVFPTIDTAKETPPHPGIVTLKSSGPRVCTIRVRTVPLPSNVTDFLLHHSRSMQALIDERGGRRHAESTEADLAQDQVNGGHETETMTMDAFLDALKKEFSDASDVGGGWDNVADKIWAFGPKRIGPNLLINNVSSYRRKPWILNRTRGDRHPTTITSSRPSTPDITPDDDQSVTSSSYHGENAEQHAVHEFDEAINTGFQICASSGPLCAEPLMGVAYFVEDFFIDSPISDHEDTQGPRIFAAPLSGQVISLTKEAFRQGILSLSPRLMLATYTCDIQAQTDVLGKVYAVVAKRKGKILSEEMKEGTPFWMIAAKLPVVESFGFADDIRKRTSGAASPQLVFSGFEILDQDPFWVPTTEEELEDLGEKADRENVAKKYMDAVRRRKGLFSERKIVEHAEKQRTLKK